jgi:uncharacterized membrane protein
MRWSLLTSAPLAIQIHLLTVVPSFFLGAWLLLWSKKGTRLHRTVGFLYMALMSITAITSLFIQSIRPGHFTAVHLFIPLTLWGVGSSLWAIRKRNVEDHKRAMYGLYIGGLILAGAFTLYPGRLLHQFFFGGN